MSVHRIARIPPVGPHFSGKRLMLCGWYMYPERGTFVDDQVTCRNCIKAMTSERTLTHNRLADE